MAVALTDVYTVDPETGANVCIPRGSKLPAKLVKQLKADGRSDVLDLDPEALEATETTEDDEAAKEAAKLEADKVFEKEALAAKAEAAKIADDEAEFQAALKAEAEAATKE